MSGAFLISASALALISVPPPLPVPNGEMVVPSAGLLRVIDGHVIAALAAQQAEAEANWARYTRLYKLSYLDGVTTVTATVFRSFQDALPPGYFSRSWLSPTVPIDASPCPRGAYVVRAHGGPDLRQLTIDNLLVCP